MVKRGCNRRDFGVGSLEVVAGHTVAGPHPRRTELPRAARHIARHALRRCRSRAVAQPRERIDRAARRRHLLANNTRLEVV
eukprot:scaffold31844_cov64-Phaeocystis_antarctica.AAC.2